MWWEGHTGGDGEHGNGVIMDDHENLIARGLLYLNIFSKSSSSLYPIIVIAESETIIYH